MHALDWTVETALIWAEMVNRIKRAGYTVGIMDTMIAASAKQRIRIMQRSDSALGRGKVRDSTTEVSRWPPVRR